MGTHARGVLRSVGYIPHGVSGKLRLRLGDVLGGAQRLPIDSVGRVAEEP